MRGTVASPSVMRMPWFSVWLCWSSSSWSMLHKPALSPFVAFSGPCEQLKSNEPLARCKQRPKQVKQSMLYRFNNPEILPALIGGRMELALTFVWRWAMLCAV